jgi:hypothetical protein
MGIETEQRLALLEQRLAALEAAVKARWVEPLVQTADAAAPAAPTTAKRTAGQIKNEKKARKA